ncbi:carbohydrate ABC transporter membrane protein 1 (CUT1 family) [Haloactinopolyspora alba]|uniref:Carbohydrate ABC transporter membrane protein 1 (CUT1 family) n=1 Tax=Haloactinopolyspora alba TaxID=648780 RepID=A0A2P8D263_9ACTN|nr:sugar ABC transporter permease [Haloactinopolyspora alba]PSK91266.1 carbohydrate ABC transporter membrane protein 1 (CUT1 family) [Haloactinopolyspora alba]
MTGTIGTADAPAPSTSHGERRQNNPNTRARRERRAAYLFLAPNLIGLTTFVAIPMLMSIVLAFFSVDGFGGYTFVGTANFERMVNDPLFLSSLGRTLIYLFVLVPGLFVSGLGLALLVRSQFPLVGLFRTALFAPNVISLVVIALIWKFLLTDDVGFVAKILGRVGITPPSWLGDPSYALATVMVITIWFSMGYYMLIFLAGLQDIPREYYEVASIDGAGPWATFRNVTWPLLKPTSFFILLTSTIAVMTGGLEMLVVLTNGGPANSTTLVIYYVYQQAFVYGEFGYASAIASIMVLILLAWSALLFALTRGGRFTHAD